MREREKDRIQRVKEAQERLKEIDRRTLDESVTSFKDGEWTISTPMFLTERRKLEIFIERNKQWTAKAQKNKTSKSSATKIAPNTQLSTSQTSPLALNQDPPSVSSHMVTKKTPRKSKKKSIDLSKPVNSGIDPTQMTEDERSAELNQILATGILRMEASKTPRQLEHEKRMAAARKNSQQPRDLLTEDMLAERWLCSASRLQRWRVEGVGIPYLKIGGRVLYRLVDVQAYEESCLVQPQPTEKRRGKEL